MQGSRLGQCGRGESGCLLCCHFEQPSGLVLDSSGAVAGLRFGLSHELGRLRLGPSDDIAGGIVCGLQHPSRLGSYGAVERRFVKDGRLGSPPLGLVQPTSQLSLSLDEGANLVADRLQVAADGFAVDPLAHGGKGPPGDLVGVQRRARRDRYHERVFRHKRQTRTVASGRGTDRRCRETSLSRPFDLSPETLEH